MIAWSVTLSAMAKTRFESFDYQKYDLGNMVQAVWSTSEGRPLEVTLGTGEQASRLASHVDPILALFAPIWLIAPSPLTLAFVQIGVVALGALPIYWLGLRKLSSERDAALMALVYLAYPWLAWTALHAMHPVTLAIPILLFAILYLDADRLGAFTACAVLAAATGELMALALAALGLWYWLARGHRRAGLVIAVSGLAWSVICVKVIVPAFAGADSPFYGYYESIGGSPEGVLQTLLDDPASIVRALSGPSDLAYVLALALPLAGAFVLAPGLAAAALPQLAANGLSSLGWLVDPRSHHIAGVVPFLAAAAVVGLGRLTPRRQALATAFVALMCLSMSLVFGPWPRPGDRLPWIHIWRYGTPPPSHLQSLHDAVALVPRTAAVSTTNRAGSYLSARRVILSVPVVRNARWIVVDHLDPWVPLPPRTAIRRTWGRSDPALLKRFVRRLEENDRWTKVFEEGKVIVFRRADDAR